MGNPLKLHILHGGYMYLDKSSMIAGYNQATASNQLTHSEWAPIPVYSYLIEHPDGLVLYDTGCDPLGMSEHWAENNKNASPHEPVENGSVEERLAQLGYTPDDIRYVVMSHLHTDHAGCLDLFKKAEIVVNDFEFTQTAKLYALHQMRPAYDYSDLERMFNAGLSWKLLDEEEVLVPLLDGITILNLGPGHTFGMLALSVDLPNSGNILIVADAIYTKENMGPPPRLPGLLYDSLGYIKSVNYAAKYAAKHNSLVLFGHDLEQMKELKLAPEGYYD